MHAVFWTGALRVDIVQLWAPVVMGRAQVRQQLQAPMDVPPRDRPDLWCRGHRVHLGKWQVDHLAEGRECRLILCRRPLSIGMMTEVDEHRLPPGAPPRPCDYPRHVVMCTFVYPLFLSVARETCHPGRAA